MKHNLKKPCAECPFRRGSTPGWLGPDTVLDVLHAVHGEGGYSCHMDVEREAKATGNEVVDPGNVEQCVGAIMHANKCFKLYRPGPLRSHQNRVDWCDDDIMEIDEFREHHKNARTQSLRKT
jgi:hypothetical protein